MTPELTKPTTITVVAEATERVGGQLFQNVFQAAACTFLQTIAHDRHTEQKQRKSANEF
jgi:hypothetical protein